MFTNIVKNIFENESDASKSLFKNPLKTFGKAFNSEIS